jgi:hypothetical protein
MYKICFTMKLYESENYLSSGQYRKIQLLKYSFGKTRQRDVSNTGVNIKKYLYL